MATISSLADRLRSEIGDFGKSFVHQFIADGTTNRFLIPYSPSDGANLVVTQNGSDVSTTVEVEEQTGYITFDVIPEDGDLIVIAGTYFRYFTTPEICQYVIDAFAQHSTNHLDSFGRAVTVQNLPGIEEYPVVIYASTMALYTLATDASFDIDIQAPDGVMIPRSERYRQLMQMIDVRKNQYKELCSQLGIGLYKIDVFTLRRISKTTNHYVPVFIPQEIDDRSYAQRAHISIPNYGSVATPSDVPNQDLVMYQGDSFEVTLDFPFDVTGYTFRADIVKVFGSSANLTSFIVDQVEGTTDKIRLSLPSSVTEGLPQRCYWDIEATAIEEPTYKKTYMRGAIFVTREATV